MVSWIVYRTITHSFGIQRIALYHKTPSSEKPGGNISEITNITCSFINMKTDYD